MTVLAPPASAVLALKIAFIWNSGAATMKRSSEISVVSAYSSAQRSLSWLISTPFVRPVKPEVECIMPDLPPLDLHGPEGAGVEQGIEARQVVEFDGHHSGRAERRPGGLASRDRGRRHRTRLPGRHKSGCVARPSAACRSAQAWLGCVPARNRHPGWSAMPPPCASPRPRSAEASGARRRIPSTDRSGILISLIRWAINLKQRQFL